MDAALKADRASVMAEIEENRKNVREMVIKFSFHKLPQREHITKNLKKLGSRYYTYHADLINAILEYVTRNFEKFHLK